MTISPALIYRWIVFLLAAGYCLRTLLFGGFDHFGGPFRYLTVWALFASFFAASRMMAIMEGRSENRWDGFVCMTAVINTMVVFLYWRLYFADPTSVTSDGELGALHIELYMHLFGPLLQVIDTIFIHRSYKKFKSAILWLSSVIGIYVIWVEAIIRPMNNSPSGSVTSGLPYPFLNNMDLPDRLIFYGMNFTVGPIFMIVFAFIAWQFRRKSPARAAL